MAIVRATAAEQRLFLATSAAGPSREEAEKREGEIGQLAESVLAQLGPEAEKGQHLILGALLAAAGPGEQPAPVYYGPWPKLMDEVVKAVRSAVPAYGAALCGTTERLFVSTAKAQKLLPPDYQPPKA